MFDRFLNAPILTTLRSLTINMKHDHNTPQKMFSIKENRSAVPCGFGHIYRKNS